MPQHMEELVLRAACEPEAEDGTGTGKATTVEANRANTPSAVPKNATGSAREWLGKKCHEAATDKKKHMAHCHEAAASHLSADPAVSLTKAWEL